MLSVYIILVEAGIRTIDSVPEKYRDAVKEALGISNDEE